MKKLLLVRNDKLGDFILAWPAFAMLKASLPEVELTALVPAYTAPLAQCCPYLDAVIIDAGSNAPAAARAQTLAAIKAARFDGVINFVSDRYNALLMWQARIPYRLAPATKWVQIFYNHRLAQRRSRSAKPEFEYNVDLARAFLRDQSVPSVDVAPPYLEFEKSAVENQKVFLSRQLALDPRKAWVFVHSGSGGSANNLSLPQYARLIQGLLERFDCEIVLTAGPGESEKARQLADLVGESAVKIYDKNQGLVDFAHSLACADLFIAGSTGPLHLAAALNRPTIGFFPAKRSATPLRWQPINAPDRHLAFRPPQGEHRADDLSHIDMAHVLATAIPFIQIQWQKNC